MRLRLVRITDPADFNYTVPVEFNAFHSDAGHNYMFGFSNPTTIAALIGHHTKNLPGSLEDCWTKIVDDDADGRIVSVAWWKVYPSFVASEYEKEWREVEGLKPKDFTYLEADGQERMEDADRVMKVFIGKRFERIKEPHIHLQLLFTDPAYHAKGAGKMMLGWGTKLADHLMIPIWVETSKEGSRLYDSFGFERIEEVHLDVKSLPNPIDYPLRRRPVKVVEF